MHHVQLRQHLDLMPPAHDQLAGFIWSTRTLKVQRFQIVSFRAALSALARTGFENFGF